MRRSGRKTPRERVPLSPKQLELLRSTFTVEFFFGTDEIDVCTLCERLQNCDMKLGSIVGRRESTDKDTLDWYDATLSEVTSSGSE